MITFHTIITWLLLFSYWLLIASVSLRILMKRRVITSAIAWLLIIYILPLVGIIAYLSFGEVYLGKRRIKRAKVMLSATTKWFDELKECKNIFATKYSTLGDPLFKLCQNRQGIAGIKGNHLKLLTKSNDVMLSLIKDIQLANYTIEMVFYIWEPGGIADVIAESLILASQRGVQCRLMLDSAGSMTFFRSEWPKKMRNAGIDVLEALQVSLLHVFLRRMDLRQHRKLILIDNYIAYTGSMNLVDPKFFKQNSEIGQWVDLMVRIKGTIAASMKIIYACDWEIETGKRIFPISKNYIIPSTKKENNHIVQIIASGPCFPENLIHQALLTVIYSARNQLIITTPYFVPSDDLLHAICTAALRKVDVNIIVPRYNDSVLVRWASRAFFSELLDAGVKIYQFEDGLLHTKSVLIDGQLSLIGSVNLDMRSLWLNFEITLIVDDIKFGKNLANIQNDYMAKSQLLDTKCWATRAWWKRILERLFNFFSPLL